MAFKVWTGLQHATNTLWTNTNNWLGGSLPVSGDYITFASAFAPSTGPSSPLSVIGFDSSGLTADLWTDDDGETDNLTIATNGTLMLAAQGSSYEHHWAGDASEALIVNINGNSVVNSSGAGVAALAGTITLRDSAVINGGVPCNGGTLYAYDFAQYNSNGTGTAYFYGNSICDGHCGGDVWLFDSASFVGGDSATTGGSIHVMSVNATASQLNAGNVGGSVYLIPGAQAGGFGIGFVALRQGGNFRLGL